MFGIRLGKRKEKEVENVGLNFQALLDEEQPGGVKITCRDCGEVFLFSEGEQKFYQDRGLRPTTRCPDCRRWRKREREEEAEQDRRNRGAR